MGMGICTKNLLVSGFLSFFLSTILRIDSVEDGLEQYTRYKNLTYLILVRGYAKLQKIQITWRRKSNNKRALHGYDSPPPYLLTYLKEYSGQA